MIFNKIWTKELNDELRTLTKNGKSVDEIKNHFGVLLEHHPNKKYCYGKILPYKTFLNGITDYEIRQKPSISFANKDDILVYFKTEKENYVLVLFYYVDSGIESYNLLFTTESSYIEYNERLSQILKTKLQGEGLSDSEMMELSEIIEKETKLNELHSVINKISYILLDIYPKLNNTMLSIGNTKRSQKINMYRDIIKNSFKNIKETELKDSFGDLTYYYKIS